LVRSNWVSVEREGAGRGSRLFGSTRPMTAAFEFDSDPVVLARDHWCHSNRLGLYSRLTPISSGWGEGKWGENPKIRKYFVKKFTFFQLVTQFVGERWTGGGGHAGWIVAR